MANKSEEAAGQGVEPSELVLESPDSVDDDIPDRDHVSPSSKTPKSLQLLYDRLKEAGMPADLTPPKQLYGPSTGLPTIVTNWLLDFELPAGRSSRRVSVNEASAEHLENVSISDWRSLERYNGVWNAKTGTVEVCIRPNGARGRIQLAEINRQPHELPRDPNDRDVNIELTDANSGAQVKIAKSEPVTAAFLFGRTFDPEGRRAHRSELTLQITPINVTTTAEADAMVERIVDSVSFDLSLQFGFGIAPMRLEARPVRARRRRTNGNLNFPRNAYPHEPIVLYQGGNDNSSSPLIRYWSFYQVFEYFFPRYSQEAALKQLSRFLRSPTFDAHRDADVLRAVDLVTPFGRGHSPEGDQLKTTLRSIVTPREVSDFIREIGLVEHFQDKKSELSKKTIRIDGPDDVIAQAAERIYDIRCRIVHSKSESVRDVGPGLLPGTHHDDLVRGELPLMEYLAQQALLASAERMTIARLP